MAPRRVRYRAVHPPPAAHAHGLLLDAREHDFSPRLPVGYVFALLEVLAPAARRAD